MFELSQSANHRIEKDAMSASHPNVRRQRPQIPSMLRSSKAVAPPPQLIGIIDDARREGIDKFTLEYSRALVMASISSLDHAMEIDFEFKSGEEMFHFLLVGAPSRTAKQWSIQFLHDSRRYSLMIQRANIRPKSPLQVKWSAVIDNDDA